MPPKKANVKTEQSRTEGRRTFFRMSLEDRIIFIKRLAILLKAGVPILEALHMLQRQSKAKSTHRVLMELIHHVEHGQFLHVGLEKFRSTFGDFAINVIRVGETSGTLHQNLDYLADELKKKKELRRKVVSALVYPGLIVVATVGIAVLLMTYVFPKILPVLQTLKGDLPFTTRTLIWTSNMFTTNGWLIALVTIAIIALIAFMLRASRTMRLVVDTNLLRLPVVGRLFKSYHVTNFCRTLGIMLKGDARIVEIIRITASTSTNLAYEKSLTELSERLTKGEKLSVFLERNEHLFPPMVWQIVTVGETTGSLSESLLYLAEIYEREVDDTTKNLSTAIEPILMVVMGLLVGFIAMSIISPIYSLTQNLTR
jgi:type IV pilus assembly protein PilC